VNTRKLGQEEKARVTGFVEEVLTYCRGPGIAVAISVGGDRLAVSAGLSNTRTNVSLTTAARFDAGCLSKWLMSIVVLSLAAEDKVDLDEIVTRYLPELSKGIAEQISLRNLLSHTAGYQRENFADPDVIAEYSWDELANSFRHRRMLFRPGTVFDYSHSATVVLGKVIERVTGRSAQECVEQMILGPLNLPARGNAAPKVAGHMFHPVSRRFVPVDKVGWAKVWTDSVNSRTLDVTSLVAIGDALLKHRLPHAARTFEGLTSPAIELPKLYGGACREEMPVAFGMGMATFPTGLYGASSTTPSQTCALRVHPQKQISIAVGINACQPFMRDYLLGKLMNSLLPQDLISVSSRNWADAFSFADLTGLFQGGLNSTLKGTIEGEELWLRIGHNPSVSRSASKQPIVFIHDENGHVVPKADLQFLSMGFFREPETATPCLMIGGNTYRKIIDA
jgi:CubicO group peptidase (beta-lactamase class C family)